MSSGAEGAVTVLFVIDTVAVTVTFFLSLLFSSKLFLSSLPFVSSFLLPWGGRGRGRSEQVAHSSEWFQWEQ